MKTIDLTPHAIQKLFPELEENIVDFSIRYFFPNLEKESNEYKALVDYIQEDWIYIHCVVMSCKVTKFQNLVTSLNLDVGEKCLHILDSKKIRMKDHFYDTFDKVILLK